MPTDTLRNRERWGIWTQHRSDSTPRRWASTRSAPNLNINRVSDDDYWTRLHRARRSLTQRLLSQRCLDQLGRAATSTASCAR